MEDMAVCGREDSPEIPFIPPTTRAPRYPLRSTTLTQPNENAPSTSSRRAVPSRAPIASSSREKRVASPDAFAPSSGIGRCVFGDCFMEFNSPAELNDHVNAHLDRLIQEPCRASSDTAVVESSGYVSDGDGEIVSVTPTKTLRCPVHSCSFSSNDRSMFECHTRNHAATEKRGSSSPEFCPPSTSRQATFPNRTLGGPENQTTKGDEVTEVESTQKESGSGAMSDDVVSGYSALIDAAMEDQTPSVVQVFECPLGCGFNGTTAHGLQFHCETEHDDGQPVSSRPVASDWVAQDMTERFGNGSNKENRNKKNDRKRSRSRSKSLERRNARSIAKFLDKNDEKDTDYQGSADEDDVGDVERDHPRPTRTLRPREPVEQPQNERGAGRKIDFTKKVRRILGGEDDGATSSVVQQEMFTKLRELASHVERRLGDEWEVPYEKSEQLADNFVTMYSARLSSLLTDDTMGNEILSKVNQLLVEMDEAGVEYQKPDDGLVEKIRRGASNGKETPTLFLCSNVGFYGRDLGDSGWGCGYRNAQMLISSLLKWPAVSGQLIKELECDAVPNIGRIQKLIHRAWNRGFGQASAMELDYKVEDTSTWIGTAEIHALFSSMRIECVMRDFANGGGGILEHLVGYVNSYFESFREHDKNAFTPPMFIQYSGHSRSIVGLDITGHQSVATSSKSKISDKVGLLIFDPMDTQHSIQPKNPNKPTREWYKKHIHCKLLSFKEDTHQILSFTGRILSDEEYKQHQMPGAGHQPLYCSSSF